MPHKKQPHQLNLFKAETTWFHVFNAMVGSGDVAKIGPHAVTIYLVIKSYTNWKSGKAFPGIETIVSKSGISRRQVLRSLAVLVEFGYLSKEKEGRKNIYTLREKVQFQDQEGRPAAEATWDYLPSAVEAARAELKNFMASGDGTQGQIINIENLTLNVQMIGNVETLNQQIVNDSGAQGDLPPAAAKALQRMRDKMEEVKENKRKKG